MDKEFIAHLSTSTLSKVYHGLRADKADLKAIDKITVVDDFNYIGTALDKVDELMVDIAEEVVGIRGEIL